jgi:LysR family transcriptional regulator, transcriptional activator for bauABCD operon
MLRFSSRSLMQMSHEDTVISRMSDLDLRLIRTFLAVVNACGVTAAQTRLNVSQPAISAQLATLETRLGFRLCERGRGGFSLTGRGERFAESALKLLEAVDQLTVEAQNLDKKLVGKLTLCLVGHTEPRQNTLISSAITQYLGRNQAVRMIIVVRPPGEIEQQIASGAIDVAIGYFWQRNRLLEYVPLFLERQLAYCGQGHPLFGQQSVPLELVAQHRWVYRSYPTPEINYFSTGAVRDGPIADNMEAAAILIMSGHYLGYLPQHYAAPYVAQGRLRAPNEEFLKHDSPFHLVTRRKGSRNEVVRAFVEDIRSAYLSAK